MSYLLDTNILSELRKRERMNSGVRRWYEGVKAEELFLSVLVLGEIRQGIESVRPRDPSQARNLDARLAQVAQVFAPRVLDVDLKVAEAWGRMRAAAGSPIPVIDGLLAATAVVHGLTLVTRNARDFKRSGIDSLDPFAASS